ncbi:unnamed protein product [Musa textilis]
MRSNGNNYGNDNSIISNGNGYFDDDGLCDKDNDNNFDNNNRGLLALWVAIKAQEARMTWELLENRDMLTNLGFSINRFCDNGKINRVRVDAYGQPNHQHEPTI